MSPSVKFSVKESAKVLPVSVTLVRLAMGMRTVLEFTCVPPAGAPRDRAASKISKNGPPAPVT